MNRVVMACVGVLALVGGSAAAAELPPYYQPGPAYNPIYTWTGFYLGINGGGGWGSSQWDGVDTFDLSGGLIGGTIGYNWQFAGAVVGAEGDIDWSGIKGTTTVLCAPGCETRNKWLATARGRLGFAFDRFLPYFTGGLALGDINATPPGLARRQHHQRRLDRWRRPGSRVGEQCEREGRVPLHRPRQLQLRTELRPRARRQRILHHQHLSRRRQRAVLRLTGAAHAQAPDFWSGAYRFHRSLPLRLGRGEGRHARGEAVEPLDEARMLAPPRSREAESAVAQRASERDLTDVGGRRERRWGGFERRERARNLAGLMIDPFRLVPLGRTPTALVDQKNRGIHQTVGEGLQAQSGKACARIGRDDAAAAGAMIEIVEDHSRIEQHRAVLEHERRNLAQWILLPHRVARIHR